MILFSAVAGTNVDLVHYHYFSQDGFHYNTTHDYINPFCLRLHLSLNNSVIPHFKCHFWGVSPIIDGLKPYCWEVNKLLSQGFFWLLWWVQEVKSHLLLIFLLVLVVYTSDYILSRNLIELFFAKWSSGLLFEHGMLWRMHFWLKLPFLSSTIAGFCYVHLKSTLENTREQWNNNVTKAALARNEKPLKLFPILCWFF